MESELLLSEEEIARRIGALTVPEVEPEGVDSPHRYYAPLRDAADEFVRQSRTRDKRFFLGIPELDGAMRGIGPSELALVVGFSHSGKTQLLLHALLANKDRRVAIFTPDETRPAVLVKLTCMIHDVSAVELEQRIFEGDETAVGLVRATADEFPHFAVFDQPLDLHSMGAALDECEVVWGGRKPQLVIFDYMELLQGVEDVKAQCAALKGWGKKRDVPLCVIHQASRYAGADGRQVTITSGTGGGETYATFLIGVRRKRDEIEARIKDIKERTLSPSAKLDVLDHQLSEAEHELRVHRNTITFNLPKNKRPPCGRVEDTDYMLDERTGRMRPFSLAAAVGRQLDPVQEALRARRGSSFQQQTWYGTEEPF